VEDFRAVEFADPGERKDAWQRLQDGMDMLKQKGALMQVENEAFATEAEELIEVLQRRMDDAAPEKEWDKEELAGLRAEANNIFDKCTFQSNAGSLPAAIRRGSGIASLR
jgi:hypothetical protein